MAELIRPIDMARLKGVTDAAVHRAMKRRIAAAVVEVDGRRLLDSEKAQELWETNTRKPGPPRGRKVKPDEAMLDPSVVPDYNTSRAANEYWKAELAQLAAKEKSGELMERKEHHRRLFNRARATRDMLEAIPARIVDELAVIADVVDPAKRFAMQEMMDREINQVLTGLADLVEEGGVDE